MPFTCRYDSPDESGRSASAPLERRQGDQSGRHLEKPLRRGRRIVLVRPLTSAAEYDAYVSASAPTNALLANVPIEGGAEVPSSRSAAPRRSRPSKKGTDRPKAPPTGSFTTRPQDIPGATLGRQERPQTSSCGSAAARSETACLGPANREDRLQASPTDSATARLYHDRSATGRYPFSRRDSPVFRSISDKHGMIYSPIGTFHLPSIGKDSPPRRERRQPQLLGSQIPQAALSRSLTSGSGASTSGESSTSSGRRAQDPSVATTGAQFFPPPIGKQILLPGFATSSASKARSPESKIGIGIETEFLLSAKTTNNRHEVLEDFTQVLAGQHNLRLASHHPRMANEVLIFGSRNRFDKWALTTDSSMSTGKEPWGIEMITPIFVAFPDSRWRTHVQATWNFLQEHYRIEENKDCGTHVHVSVEGGYSLEELKRIASAVISFEPAFEALVPEHRRQSCEYARSIWIGSREFAANGLTRAQCVLKLNETKDFHEFLALMQPYSQRGLAWNFQSITKYYTVEFRKPPASKTAREALGWAELAMTFIQTSMKHGTSEKLKLVPPTIGGLRWFLRQNHSVPGFNEPEQLSWIWEAKDPNEFVEARPLDHTETSERLATTRRTIDADRRRILRMIKSRQEPYWEEREAELKRHP